jgi:hypothetical protein
VGGLIGGKKARYRAALGGGASTIYEATNSDRARGSVITGRVRRVFEDRPASRRFYEMICSRNWATKTEGESRLEAALSAALKQTNTC